ncbi:MAG: SDR family oxidoreductase, partial [Steroidobacteraceae bacterium]|nr:SDR family oxidoreductase [Steroidobacteraceae bacterium]
AAGGLGAATARLFVAEGAYVVIADVDADRGRQLAAELGDAANFAALDVCVESQWERLTADLVRRFGRFDILVNNAAVVEVGTIETQTAEQWRRVLAVAADGTFFGCKHAVRSMKSTGGGTIVNVASVASMQGEPYVVAYCAAKGAVEALTRAVAVYCAQNRLPIRCNSLHPGPIQTPMVEALGAKIAAAVRTGELSPPPALGSGGFRAAPEDVATSVLYLASEASKWVNGARLVVDNTGSVTRGFVPA